jgi:hypothetical protein
VTLALEGHRITAGAGANMGFSSAISNSSDGVTGTPVADVHILGPGLITNGGGNTFVNGVFLLGGVTGSEVSEITVRGSRFAGIFADGQAFGVTGLTFTKNTLGGNNTGIGNDTGILLSNVTSSTISENDASGNVIGIEIDNGFVMGPPIMLSRNIVNGNINTGVVIDTGFVTAQNNITSGNGVLGIHVTASRGVTIALEITNNKSLANGMFDLFDSVPGCGAVWSGNTFFTANQSCIH